MVFVVTVHKITQAILPEWSDDFCTGNIRLQTRWRPIGEYIRKQLEEEHPAGGIPKSSIWYGLRC